MQDSFPRACFNERKEVGRSREEREGRWLRVHEMISTVFFPPKLHCAAQWNRGLQMDSLVSPNETNATRLALWGYEGVYVQRNNII